MITIGRVPLFPEDEELELESLATRIWTAASDRVSIIVRCTTRTGSSIRAWSTRDAVGRPRERLRSDADTFKRGLRGSGFAEEDEMRTPAMHFPHTDRFRAKRLKMANDEARMDEGSPNDETRTGKPPAAPIRHRIWVFVIPSSFELRHRRGTYRLESEPVSLSTFFSAMARAKGHDPSRRAAHRVAAGDPRGDVCVSHASDLSAVSAESDNAAMQPPRPASSAC